MAMSLIFSFSNYQPTFSTMPSLEVIGHIDLKSLFAKIRGAAGGAVVVDVKALVMEEVKPVVVSFKEEAGQ